MWYVRNSWRAGNRPCQLFDQSPNPFKMVKLSRWCCGETTENDWCLIILLKLRLACMLPDGLIVKLWVVYQNGHLYRSIVSSMLALTSKYNLLFECFRDAEVLNKLLKDLKISMQSYSTPPNNEEKVKRPIYGSSQPAILLPRYAKLISTRSMGNRRSEYDIPIAQDIVIPLPWSVP